MRNRTNLIAPGLLALAAFALAACGSGSPPPPSTATPSSTATAPATTATGESPSGMSSSAADAGASGAGAGAGSAHADCEKLVDDAQHELDAEKIAVDKQCKKDADCMAVKSHACDFACDTYAIPKSEEKEWNAAMTKVKDGACKKWSDAKCPHTEQQDVAACKSFEGKKAKCQGGHCVLK